MKSILMSIKPEQVANILNGDKTIEIRKKFPKNYVGWMYIYCTKDSKIYLSNDTETHYSIFKLKDIDKCYKGKYCGFNGKVVARFWCYKVEEIEFNTLYDDEFEFDYHTKTLDFGHLVSSSQITYEQMNNYLGNKNGYAIHISKLEIFDRPKELSEFKVYNKYANPYLMNLYIPLTKAPSNYCYIEGEE